MTFFYCCRPAHERSDLIVKKLRYYARYVEHVNLMANFWGHEKKIWWGEVGLKI